MVVSDVGDSELAVKLYERTNTGTGQDSKEKDEDLFQKEFREKKRTRGETLGKGEGDFLEDTILPNVYHLGNLVSIFAACLRSILLICLSSTLTTESLSQSIQTNFD